MARSSSARCKAAGGTRRHRDAVDAQRPAAQAPLELQPRIVLSDPDALCRAALLGLGVALVAMPHALVPESGAPLRVLPRWYALGGPISLYFTSGRLLPAKTRALVDLRGRGLRA
jgi:DNA-binding transcriptional LysR family regulator